MFGAMGEVISKSELAERCAVEPATVSAWIRRGHLTPPALMADRRIDVEAAVDQLRGRLDPARSCTQFDGAVAPSDAAPSLIEQQRRQRIEEGELRLSRMRREEAEALGQYVRADTVKRQWARLIGQAIAAFEIFLLLDLPGQLGLDSQQTADIRTAWRAFRERQAATIEQSAPSPSPDLTKDDQV